MSIRAMTWAYDQDVRPTAKKFLLVTLGDYASDETGFSYPSISTLAKRTAMDRKTAIGHLDALIKEGFISDTGKRVGNTKQVIVYRINYKPSIAGQKAANSPKNGTLPKSGNSPVFSGNSPENGTRILQRSCQKDPPEVSAQQESKKESAAAKATANRPSLESMKLYGAKIGLPDEESEACFDHFTANGWRVGRNPVRDWQACMRTWKRNWYARRFVPASVNGNGHHSAPSPTAVRIGLENELKRVEAEIAIVKGEMQYDWDRTPERKSKLHALQGQRDKLSLTLSRVGFGAVESVTSTVTAPA